MGSSGAQVVSGRIERPRQGVPGLRSLWTRSLEEPAPDSIALVRSDRSTLSYAQLAEAVRLSANDLSVAGARSGVVVGVAVADPSGFLIAALAAWECGATVLPLDARAGSGAVDEQAFSGGAAMVVRSAQQLEQLPGARAIDPQCGLLLFTSGSSGPPKGVLLGREGLAANIDAILGYLPIARARRTAVVLPLTYSYALVGQALTTLRAQGTLLLLGDLKYPALQLDTMAREGAQGLSSVPTSLKLLARARLESSPANSTTSSLCYVASAGARLDGATVALLRQAFPDALLFNQYGLTEASPRVAAIDDDHPAFAQGAAGFPLAGIEVWAEDDAGNRLPAGETGAIFVRGPSVMLGYLDDAESSARALSPDGALRTGDVGFIGTDGALFIEGRSDGVVKIGGERVGVEGVAESLRAARGVAFAAVVAIADESLGAKLFAFIEGDSGALNEARIEARRLAPARRPSRIVQLESLPRTSRGKIDLVALKALAINSGGPP